MATMPLVLAALALVVAVDEGVVAHREVGRFQVGPGEVFVAVLGVAAALALAVGQPLTAHAAAVGGVVPGGGEALDGAGLQQDGQPQHLADAADTEQVAIGRA